jgi:hypothetical protein
MDYTRKVVKDLSGKEYFGRGYVNRGDSLAALYLKKELKGMKLKSFSKDYYQSYTTPINTYPEDLELTVGTKKLEPASDFMVYPNSPSCEGTFDLVWLNKKVMTSRRALKEFLKKDLSNSFVVVDSTGLKNKELYKFASQLVSENLFKAKGVIQRAGKLKFSAKTYVNDYTTLVVKKSVLDTTAHQIKVKVKNQFIEEYRTQNLAAYIPGKSDSCIIFTAHYDHLGMMGSKMYPGANDNASGVAMVLNMAKHYKKKRKPHYTLVFLLVSGEEAGFLGSEYYVENPLIPLEKTKMVINFDMVATGTEAIYLINGKTVPRELAKLNAINKKKEYVFEMYGTGESASSDHAPFHEKGVKAIFFYTHGGNGDYHETTDVSEKLPYTQFEGIFKLVRDYIDGK